MVVSAVGIIPTRQVLASTTVVFDCPNFEAAVREIIGVPDGPVMSDDVENETHLIIPGREITSLVGIEYFNALEVLDVSGNLLTVLDVTDNEDLRYLNASNNRLNSIDVLGLVHLEELHAQYNELIILDISNNINLIELVVHHNFMPIIGNVVGYNARFPASTGDGSDGFTFIPQSTAWQDLTVTGSELPAGRGATQSGAGTYLSGHTITIRAGTRDDALFDH